VRIGWHLDGMPWDAYLRLPWYDRWILHEELGALISSVDDDSDGESGTGGGMRPKDWRK